MKKLLLTLFLSLPLLLAGQDIGGDYYVAVYGSDNNPGTYDLPFATWQRAVQAALPGDTVYIRGGVYYSDRAVSINPEKYGGAIGSSGTKENPICYFGYPGEWPILDCINHCDVVDAEGRTNVYNSGISISSVEHIKFKDFEVRNVHQCDSVVSAGIGSSYSRYLTFEHIVLNNIGQRGFSIWGGAWITHYEDELGGANEVRLPYWDTPDDSTYFINCDVYNLCDTLTSNPGGASDAWITMSYRGNYMEWRGCRAWNYTDDGLNPTLANGGTLKIDSCWFMPGSKYRDALGYKQEQNGMKLNGVGQDYYIMTPADPYTVISNTVIAFANHGFYALENPGRGNFMFKNNLSYKSQNAGFGINGGGRPGYPHSAEFYNNIEYGAYATVAGGVGYGGVYIAHDNGYCYKESNNTWICDDGYPYASLNAAFTVDDNDFVNLDDAEIIRQLTAPRKPDGSLPDITVFQLAEGSDLINAGVDVGIPFIGSAPDLGPFEFGTPSEPIIPMVNDIVINETTANPADNLFAIFFNYNRSNTVNITVTDYLTSQFIYSKSFSAKSGTNKVVIELFDRAAGIYKIELSDGISNAYTLLTKK